MDLYIPHGSVLSLSAFQVACGVPGPFVSSEFWVRESGVRVLLPVSQFGLAIALISRRSSVRICFGSPFSSKVVVCGHRLVTMYLTINKTIKGLSSLPILKLESF